MDKDRLNEINEILDLGKKILDIEKIITSTKYMKQHQIVISVMKNIKTELVNEISSYYKEPTYSVDNSTITPEPILEVTPEPYVKYTTEEVLDVEEPVNVDKYMSDINTKIKESLAHKKEDINFIDEAKNKENESVLPEIVKEKRRKPNAYSKKKK